MRLTSWEEERLLVFTAAELARRHRAAGLRLNAPEAIALICDAMLEAARADADYVAVEAAGRAAVRHDEVMPGVRALVDEVRLEVLVGDGTRLIVLLDPLAPTDGEPGAATSGAIDADAPGAIIAKASGPAVDEGRTRIELPVRSTSRRVIHVSSHFPFHRVNPRLEFDREAARGFRLDLPSGAAERWAPGETRSVRLVAFGGHPSRSVDHPGGAR
jgi:urease subunit gamma/beta